MVLQFYTKHAASVFSGSLFGFNKTLRLFPICVSIAVLLLTTVFNPVLADDIEGTLIWRVETTGGTVSDADDASACEAAVKYYCPDEYLGSITACWRSFRPDGFLYLFAAYTCQTRKIYSDLTYYPTDGLVAAMGSWICPADSTGATYPTADHPGGTCRCRSGFSNNGNASLCLGPNKPDSKKDTKEPGCNGSNPCDAGTGNKFQSQEDYAGVGNFPLKLARTYNSGGTEPLLVEKTVWGSQWRGFYDRSIKFKSMVDTVTSITTNYATVLREDGHQEYFRQSGNVFTGDADVATSLVRLGVDTSGNPTGWKYTGEKDEVEIYDANGKLLSIANRTGQVQSLTYSDGTAGTNGSYVLDAAGNATTTLLPAGKLIRVSDPAGKTLQYGYNALGQVVKAIDPSGGIYLYTYSKTSITLPGGVVATTFILTGVTYPGGKTRQYLYGEAANVSATPNTGVSYGHALTGIVDENGSRYASWTYDAAGRATSSEHGAFGSGIDRVVLAYGAPDANGDRTTNVTDAQGSSRFYNFSTISRVTKNTGVTGAPCAWCNAAVTYDAHGNVASRTDFNGHKTCYAYDLSRNLETVRVEGIAAGVACPTDLSGYAPSTASGKVERKISTTWNASYRMPTVVAEPLRITSYNYDAQGNLLGKTVQPTNDATGGAGYSAAASGTPRSTVYTYNTLGQVLTVNGPRSDVADITGYTYYAVDASCTGASALGCRGQLAGVVNALDQSVVLGDYDANGRVGSITDPNGLVTTLLYDARGRLTSRSSGGETTGYAYDGVGQLITVTTAGGAVYTYTYDAAHRLTDIADNSGNRIHYTLDAMGNRTKEEIFDSSNTLTQTHSREFDALNRLWKDIGAVNQTTVYEYDANGNLTTITDPLNRQTVNLYDALNRLSQTTDAAAGITRYGYDGQDQLVSVTDPRSLVTQYSRDGLGNLNQQSSPDTGSTGMTYDAAGNVLTRTDAKGQVANYAYDALNRLTGIAYSGGSALQTVAYVYDQGTNGIGHLTQIVDSTGTTAYSYDQHGRLTGETRQSSPTVSYTTGYGYDAQGRLNSISYPSGRAVNYSFDGMGRISQISTSYNGVTTVLASNIQYEPFGGVHSFTYGDGTATPLQTYVRQRDQDGRIASYSLNGKAMSIGYDAASQISFIADPQNLANTANYGYDDLSRLTSYSQSAINQGYGYDGNGNRVTQTIGSTISNYSYAADNNRLTGIQTGAATQSVMQDANGATTGDATRQYSYDLRGRLIQTTTAQGVINYEVNALGLRVRKQVPYANTDTQYHYDTQGHLIGESDTGSGQFAREYIYLGDQPVAVMQ